MCDENVSIACHPIYKNYGYNRDTNEIINFDKNQKVNENSRNTGYTGFTLYTDDKIPTPVYTHRFIWECCNSLIPRGYEVDHINKIRNDNRICNLRCVTISQNRKERDHTRIKEIAKNAHKMKRIIKAVNVDNEEEVYYFPCKNQCSKFFSVSPAMIYLICENKIYIKHANTEKGKFRFEYSKDNEAVNLISFPHGNCKKLNLKTI